MSSADGPGHPRRPHPSWTSALALVLGLVVGAALVGAVGTAAAEAQIRGDPALSLEPSTGPPGTLVTAVVTGFDDCQDFTAPYPRGDVAIVWDRERVATVNREAGDVRASFTVPSSAVPGSPDVIAWCDLDDEIRATAEFVVLPPVEVRAVVPDVVGSSRDGAVAAIVDADLDVGQVIGDGEVVRTQDPPAGTEVDPGSSVDLDLGTVAPQLDVEVPDLVGADLGDVPAVLAERGLVLGGVRGEGDVVSDQDPAAGTRVPSGSAVNVSVEADVLAEVLVAVPDVGGLTADEARAAVEAAGLVLGGGLEGDERVAAQDPPPGTLVALGSVVTVSAEVATTPAVMPDLPGSWLVVLAVFAALLVAVWLARRVLRSRRDRRWVRRHVRAEPGRTTSSGPVLREDDDGRPTRVVRLEPHLDADPPTLEEVAP